MRADLAGTAEYAEVEEHLQRLHSPGFGRPHALPEVEITSDGADIVVTGAVLDRLEGTPRMALYRVRDGALVPLTTGPGSSRRPRFSQDGRTLAFLSDRRRERMFQLFLLGGERMSEARAAPAVPGIVEDVQWSPDDAHLLLTVAAPGADVASSQGSGTIPDSTASGAPDWHPHVSAGSFTEARSLWLYTTATGRIEQLSPDGSTCWEAAWCGPDHVLAVVSAGAAEDDWYSASLARIDRRTRAVAELLRPESQIGLPSGSPSGRYAAVVQGICSDRGVIAGDLTVLDLGTSARTEVDAKGTDITRVQWLDDRRLGYVGLRNMDSVAGLADPVTGRVEELLATPLSFGGGYYPDGVFTAEGRFLTTRHSYRLPPRVSLLQAGAEDPLASVAGPGSDYLLTAAGSIETVSWAASDGQQIEGLLCRPAGEGPFPLIVNIHGGPVWAFRDTWSMSYPWVPLLVAHGYAVLSPNPRASSSPGAMTGKEVVMM